MAPIRTPFVFVLMPFSSEFDDVYAQAIKPACNSAGARCERVDEQIFTESILERIINQIAKADIVVADVTHRNPNVFYEIGYTHAFGVPTILLTKNANDIPFDLMHHAHIVYGGSVSRLKGELEKRVRWHLERLKEKKKSGVSHGSVLSNLKDESRPSEAGNRHGLKRSQVFISYSHKDQKWLKRLQVHMKPLERTGVINRWDDTMLTPGVDWRESIRAAVGSAKVAVLLVSADFIASDFIYTNELPPLLAAAKEEGAVILPVIVSPSRFDKIKNISQFQAVNAPDRPLIKMTKNQQEALLVQVTEAIEKALGAE